MMCEDFAPAAMMEDKLGLKSLQQKTCKYTIPLKRISGPEGQAAGDEAALYEAGIRLWLTPGPNINRR